MAHFDRDVRLVDQGGTPYGPGNPVPTTGSGGGGGGAVTVADGADVCEGTTADAAVTGDNPGTISAKLRGINQILASVWDSLGGRLKVDGSNVTQPVSGTVSIGNSPTVNQGTGGSSAWKVDGSAVIQPVKTEVELDYDTGAGTQNLSVVGIGLPASGGAVAGGTGTNPIRVDPTGTTAQPVSGSVSVSNFPGTQPVSGTVTANQGTAGSSPWPVKTEVELDYDTGAGTQNLSVVGLGLPASGGAVAGGTAANPLRTDPTGTTPQPISATSLPLPAGAATETTLAGIKTGTDKIPASPATDRTTAAAPFAVELSDGSAFYTAAKTGQLPSALTGSGNLKVALAETTVTQPVSGTITASPGQGSLIDRSGMVTTGGTAQTLAAANASRIYLMVQNNDQTTSANNLWINFGTAAVQGEPSILIPPGATYVSDPQFVSNQSVSIIGPNTGQTWSAKEA